MKHLTPEVQVKAAGSIRGLKGFLNVKAIGCTRVGTGQTERIVLASLERFGE